MCVCGWGPVYITVCVCAYGRCVHVHIWVVMCVCGWWPVYITVCVCAYGRCVHVHICVLMCVCVCLFASPTYHNCRPTQTWHYFHFAIPYKIISSTHPQSQSTSKTYTSKYNPYM